LPDGSEIRLSAHARRRARRWTITIQELKEALANRESVRLSGQDDRLVIMGITAAGRRLKIVVPTSDEAFVVTCAAQGWRR
jgi:hypothetical protein